MQVKIPTPKIEEPIVRGEDYWFSMITGLTAKDFLPRKNGRLFGPRDEKHPV